MGSLDGLSRFHSATAPAVEQIISSASTVQLDEAQSVPDREESLSDEPIELNEMESTSDQDFVIDEHIGNFRSLAGKPRPGSLIYHCSKSGVSQRKIESYLTSTWGLRVIMAWLAADVDLDTYILYSMVCNHSDAIELAEEAHKAIQEGLFPNSYAFLTAATGMQIDSRADILDKIKLLARKSNVLLSMIMNFMKKMGGFG